MKVGFMGLGKLGLPCALAIEAKGHEVRGHDPDKKVDRILATGKIPYREEGAQEFLDNSNIQLVSVTELVRWADIFFVPIQTPHDIRFEGITPLTNDRMDFDYTYLVKGVTQLSKEIEHWGKTKTVIIISTVLPGTIRRDIYPVIGRHTKLCYNPFFIAMGTTMRDFLNPEFVLFGTENDEVAEEMKKFYSTIHDKPFVRMSIESAELTKVAYNTFITAKITITNLLMEICEKVPGADVDEVTGALKMATDRIISPKYLNGGMGDGGGCHPRDNIALSWLARRLNLSFDIYESLMLAREYQTEWFANLIKETLLKYVGKKAVILGKAFKKETNLTVGSPAILLKNLLLRKGIPSDIWDPHVDGGYQTTEFPVTVYFIGVNHPEFKQLAFPEGSTILDPWGMIEDQPGVEVIRIGRK